MVRPLYSKLSGPTQILFNFERRCQAYIYLIIFVFKYKSFHQGNLI
jgi:hypothetical protein